MTDVAAGAAPEVGPPELDSFVALGLTGRRNALGDILDESITKTSTKTLVDKLQRLKSTDIPNETAQDNRTNASSVESSSNTGNQSAAETDKIS